MVQKAVDPLPCRALAGVVLRMPFRVSILAGVALAQVGEFSFVLADVALQGQVIGGHLFDLIDATEKLVIVAGDFNPF